MIHKDDTENPGEIWLKEQFPKSFKGKFLPADMIFAYNQGLIDMQKHWTEIEKELKKMSHKLPNNESVHQCTCCEWSKVSMTECNKYSWLDFKVALKLCKKEDGIKMISKGKT